jgi:Superinfection immunity protein
MIPTTLTPADAQRLLALNRAHLHGATCLTTPRATYTWNTTTQVYDLQEEVTPAKPAPRAHWGAIWGMTALLLMVGFWCSTWPGWDTAPWTPNALWTLDPRPLCVVLFLGLYFLPSVIAQQRHHHQASAIRALNSLAGFTVLGWIIAFVWAWTATAPGATQGQRPRHD